MLCGFLMFRASTVSGFCVFKVLEAFAFLGLKAFSS